MINVFETSYNIKKRIIANVKEAVHEFESRPECTTKFGTPIIGYVSCHHPYFDKFFDSGLSIHPKQIYRAGNTVCAFFVPYSKEVLESNKGGNMPSKEWTKAYFDSMHLCMYLNRIIRDTLDEIGRLHSGTHVPTEWNEEEHKQDWSPKLALLASGLGRMGIGGSIRTELGFAGRASTILIDEHYAPVDEEELETIDLDHCIEHIKTDSKFLGADDVFISQEAINACPAGAISKDGINQEICQNHCAKINSYTPSPEVCGKCFYFDA